MAKETAAQRDARFDAETKRQLMLDIEVYPARLMSVLARATKSGFELEVIDNKFVITDRNERSAWTLEYEHSPNSWDELQELMWTLDAEERAAQEARRIAQVKSDALRKINEVLTKEERELLNL